MVLANQKVSLTHPVVRTQETALNSHKGLQKSTSGMSKSVPPKVVSEYLTLSHWYNYALKTYKKKIDKFNNIVSVILRMKYLLIWYIEVLAAN